MPTTLCSVQRSVLAWSVRHAPGRPATRRRRAPRATLPRAGARRAVLNASSPPTRSSIICRSSEGRAQRVSLLLTGAARIRAELRAVDAWITPQAAPPSRRCQAWGPAQTAGAPLAARPADRSARGRRGTRRPQRRVARAAPAARQAPAGWRRTASSPYPAQGCAGAREPARRQTWLTRAELRPPRRSARRAARPASQRRQRRWARRSRAIRTPAPCETTSSAARRRHGLPA
mmetsp:Transcript_8259/g.26124  ORF Transcript_8259/g.26124 Transcript_8259/m.26124 type:complete len:232 (+) Transcript_8259:76-771(+)